MDNAIKYRRYDNGKPESYTLGHEEMVVDRKCVFDGTPLTMNWEYGNRDELFCHNCGSAYENGTQEEIDSQKPIVLQNLEKKIGQKEEKILELKKYIKDMKRTKRILTRLITEPISQK